MNQICAQDATIYWCVACGRGLIAEVHEHGLVFIHDDVPHPKSLKFDEDQLKH